MTPGSAALAAGALGLALWGLLAALGAAVMPSYLAAWLLAMALPLGALPLVMGFELAGRDSPVLPPLRRMLLLMPVGALLALPVAFRLAPLYHRAGMERALPAAWMATGPFLLRMAVLLAVWSVLALLFAHAPRRERRGLAVLGLALHLPMTTVAAVDWVMALDPGVASTAFGLLLLAAQAGAALALALFLVAVASTEPVPATLAWLLGTALGAWVFLHLVQYLVVWSANLPDEVVWYQLRANGLGAPAAWFGAAAAALAFAAMAPHGWIGRPAVMASVAAMLFAAHAVEMLWLVTPPFRGALRLAWADGAALVGLGGIAAFVLSPLLPGAHRAPA